MAKVKKIKKITKKSQTAKNRRTQKPLESEEIMSVPQNESPNMLMDQASVQKPKIHPILILVLAVLAVTLVALVRNGLLVSAIIDGSPIWSWQYYGAMNKRFGNQVMESIITEKLIENAAKNANIVVTKEEIAKKQDTLLASLGSGVSLDDVLKFQGITKQDFDRQIELQTAIEKILGKDISITDDEIANYISTNSSRLSSTDAAMLKEEAKNEIFNTRISDKIQPWFTELKAKAKIWRVQ